MYTIGAIQSGGGVNGYSRMKRKERRLNLVIEDSVFLQNTKDSDSDSHMPYESVTARVKVSSMKKKNKK